MYPPLLTFLPLPLLAFNGIAQPAVHLPAERYELVDARGTRMPIQRPERQLDVSGLPAGPYVARILTGKGLLLARFLKL